MGWILGINAASDVYSLGMVIFSTMLPLLYQLDIVEDDATQYVRIVAGMIYEDPVKRLSVMGALKEFFTLLDCLGNVSIESRHESRCRLLFSVGLIHAEVTNNIIRLCQILQLIENQLLSLQEFL